MTANRNDISLTNFERETLRVARDLVEKAWEAVSRGEDAVTEAPAWDIFQIEWKTEEDIVIISEEGNGFVPLFELGEDAISWVRADYPLHTWWNKYRLYRSGYYSEGKLFTPVAIQDLSSGVVYYGIHADWSSRPDGLPCLTATNPSKEAFIPFQDDFIPFFSADTAPYSYSRGVVEADELDEEITKPLDIERRKPSRYSLGEE